MLRARLFGSYAIGFVKRQLCTIEAAASMTSLRGPECLRFGDLPRSPRHFVYLYSASSKYLLRGFLCASLYKGFSNCGSRRSSGSRIPLTWVVRMLFAKTLLQS